MLDNVNCLEFFQANVSETESVSVMRCKAGNVPTQSGCVRKSLSQSLNYVVESSSL
jgi:hypothetical protein